LNWDDVWKVVLTAIASVGGISGVIFLVIKFSADQIAERLSKKYELKLNKELEAYKIELGKKEYVSKTKFDAEFQIYRELSKAFFGMVRDINSMIPAGLAHVPANEEARKKYENDCFLEANRSTVNAQDMLNQNAPFIPADFYDKLTVILKLCRQQLNVFSRRWNVLCLVSQEKERLDTDDYNRTTEINEKLKALNNEIREYLSTLEVVK